MPRDYGFGRADWISPLLHQIDRQGQNIMYADEARRANDRNAIQNEMFQLQMAKEMRAAQEQNALKQSLAGAAEPGADLEKIGMALVAAGRPEGLELIIKAREMTGKGGFNLGPGETRFDASGKQIAQNSAPKLSGDAANLQAITGRMPTVEDLMRMKQANTVLTLPYRQEALEQRKDEGSERNRLAQERIDDQKQARQSELDRKNELTEEKNQQAKAKDAGLKRMVDSDLISVERQVDKILEKPGLKNITGYVGQIPFSVRQDTKDVEALMKRLKANLFVGTMNNLKTVSVNGSTGLGQATEREGQKLEDMQAALESAQSYEQMVEQLKGIKAWSQGLRTNMARTFEETWSGRREADKGAGLGPKPKPVESGGAINPNDVKWDN